MAEHQSLFKANDKDDHSGDVSKNKKRSSINNHSWSAFFIY